MNKSLYQASPFEAIRQVKNGQEFWSARDMQNPLGYDRWENFEDAIERAMAACQNGGHKSEEQFRDATKLQNRGNRGATQEIKDYHLSRYACYLTAMNGDPRKPEIAAAQTYFAIKTREAETAQAEPAPAQLAFDFNFNLQVHTFQDIERVEQGLALLKKAHALLTGNTTDLTSLFEDDTIGESELPKSVQVIHWEHRERNLRERTLKCIRKLQKKQPPTFRDVYRYFRKDEREALKTLFYALQMERVISSDNTGKSPRYELN